MKNSSLDISEIVPAPMIMRSDPWNDQDGRGHFPLDSARDDPACGGTVGRVVGPGRMRRRRANSAARAARIPSKS